MEMTHSHSIRIGREEVYFAYAIFLRPHDSQINLLSGILKKVARTLTELSKTFKTTKKYKQRAYDRTIERASRKLVWFFS